MKFLFIVDHLLRQSRIPSESVRSRPCVAVTRHRALKRFNHVKEIICPNCGKAFTIDEAGYADILKQVRDTDFEKQLHERLELADQEKQRAIELAETKAAGELQKAAAAKDSEIQALKAKLDAGESANKVAVEWSPA